MSTQCTIAAFNGLVGLAALGATIGGIKNGGTKINGTENKTIDLSRRLLLAESFFLMGASIVGGLPCKVGSNITLIGGFVSGMTIVSLAKYTMVYPSNIQQGKQS